MDTLMETISRAYGNFTKIKHSVDTALMGAALSAAGEPEMAQRVMAEEQKD